MKTYRKTAITVGVLYIFGTVTGVLSLLLTNPLLDARATLLTIAAQGNQIRLGALLVFMMGIALAMVPVMMFPILKSTMKSSLSGMLCSEEGSRLLRILPGQYSCCSSRHWARLLFSLRPQVLSLFKRWAQYTNKQWRYVRR